MECLRLTAALLPSLLWLVTSSALGQAVLLHQTSPSPATVQSWSFVSGVPLPRGSLADVKTVRLLDAGGREIPAQFQALAHWSPVRDSVKWLRVVFNAPARKGRAPQYSLLLGHGGTAAPIPRPIKVTEDEQGISVDTGAVALVVSKTAGGRLARVERQGREVYRAAALDGPYVIDHQGATYRAALDPAPNVTVEESGPLRVVVRAEAWHLREHSPAPAGPAGDRLNKSITRYYAYAGQPWIEQHWTFVITADTDAVRFKDIGLRMSGSGKTRLGLDDGNELELDDGYLLQKKSDLYCVRRNRQGEYRQVAAGAKAPGWIACDGFSLAMRDFWQTFPRELEVVPAVSAPGEGQSALIVHAWPGRGEYNHDWFAEPATPPSPGANPPDIVGATGVRLSPAYFQWLQRWHHGPLLDFHYPDWWRNPIVAGTRGTKSWLDKIYPLGNDTWEFFGLWSAAEMPKGIVKEIATGTSRTQRLLLDFSGDRAEEAGRRALFLSPPHVWAKDRQWLATTRVQGPLYAKAADAWDEASLKSWKHVDQQKFYGLWLWGNMPEYFNAKDGSPAIYRLMNGSAHYGYFYTHWLLYMCTGRPEHLRYAMANTEHWRDVAVVHYAPPELENLPDRAAKILGATPSVAFYPWRMAVCFDFYSGVAHLLWDYYLTGDRHSLETAALHATNLIARRNGVGFTRETGGNQKTVIDWYAHSWDPKAAAWIDHGIAGIVAGDPTGQKSRAGTPLNWQNFVAQYLDLTTYPDIPLKHRAALVAWVRTWCERYLCADGYQCGYPGLPGNLLAAAYFATGEAKYLHPYMRHMLGRAVPRDRWLVPAEPRLGCGTGGAVYFDQVLYCYAAFADAIAKNLVPATEDGLPVPPPVTSFTCPVNNVYYGKSANLVFLKQAGKEVKVCYRPTGAPVKLTLLAPDGSTIRQQQADGPVELLVPPNGTPGAYRLLLEGEGYKFAGIMETASRFMVEKPEKDVSLPGPMDWHFLVPKDARRLTVKCGGLLFNADSQLMKVPDSGVLDVPPEQSGRLWRFRPFPSGGGGNLAYLKLDGAQPYLAPHRTYWWDMTGEAR